MTTRVKVLGLTLMLRLTLGALACGHLLAPDLARAQAVGGVHRVTKIAPGIWVAEPRFGGANATIIAGEDHVVLVDPHSDPATANALIEEVRALTGLPIRFVVNTHWHGDHHGGNRALEEAFPGQVTFISHASTRLDIQALATRELRQMGTFYERFGQAAAAALESGTGGGGEPLDEAQRAQLERYVRTMRDFVAGVDGFEYRLPTLTVADRATLHAGNRMIEVQHFGPAHTRGDLLVRLPDDRIVIAGDLLTAPYVVPRSGYPSAYAAALRALADLDAEQIVLGHGGPTKGDGQLALLMAEFLEASVSYAERALAEGRSLDEAVTGAALHPGMASFETRIDWEEPGLRFLDFERLVAMTVTRAYQEAAGELDGKRWIWPTN